jgi:hypothetical protein
MGFRGIEARRLKPIDFDLDRKVVTLNDPVKGNRPKQFKISDNLVSMMHLLIHRTQVNDPSWGANLTRSGPSSAENGSYKLILI